MRKLIVYMALFLTGITGYSAAITSAANGNWSNTATWAGGVVPGSNDSVTILAAHTVSLTASASCIHLTISGTLNITGNYQFTVSGTLTMIGAGAMNSSDETQLAINDYSGSSPLFVIPDGVVNLRKLTLNRGAGASSDHNLDLDNNVPSAGYSALVLTDGILYMTSGVGSDLIYYRSSNLAKSLSANDSAHVQGRLSRDIEKNAGWHSFPMGDEGHHRGFEVSSISNGTCRESIVQFFWDAYYDLDYTASLPGGVHDKYYWEHEKVICGGARPNVSRRFYFEVGDFGINFDTADLLMATFNDASTNWSAITTGTTRGPNYMNQTTDNSSNNKAWTWGSASSPILPVLLINFDADVFSDRVDITWTTAAEINCESFLLERTTDGTNFETIALLDGGGNSSRALTYVTSDMNPVEGIAYYRLKQTDFDGTYTYSPLIAVKFEPGTHSYIKVFPNPCRDNCSYTIGGFGGDASVVGIYDVLGNKIVVEEIEGDDGTIYMKTPQNLSPGVYLVSASRNGMNIQQKFIVH